MHRDPHKLSELLDVVEIVLGFLASAGGKPEQTFHSYVTKTLTMQRAHIPKVINKHVLYSCILKLYVLSQRTDRSRTLTEVNIGYTCTL